MPPGWARGWASWSLFPTHFSWLGIGRAKRQGASRAKGRELCPSPPRTPLGSRSDRGAASSARDAGPKGASRAGARPPVPVPLRRGGPQPGRPPPLAQDWHARASEPGANSTTCRARRPGRPHPRVPGEGLGGRTREREAGGPPTPHGPVRPDAPLGPARQRQRQRRRAALRGRFRRRAGGLLPRRAPVSGGRHSPEAAAAPSLRLRQADSATGAFPPGAPRPWPEPGRELFPQSSKRCPARRRTRGHGRAVGRADARGRAGVGAGSSLRLGRRLLLLLVVLLLLGRRRCRLLPSSGLCCNVCETDLERLARRPPAAALLPPPPSPPRPSPSPRRSTPFSSSAKFLNPFSSPRPPIVTGPGGRHSVLGSPRELGTP